MGTVEKQGEVSTAQCCNVLSAWAPASHLSALCLGFLNYKVESSSTHFMWLLWGWRCNHVKYLERRVVSSEEPFRNGLCKSKQGGSTCVFSVLAGGSVVLGFGYGVMVNGSQELWDWAWRGKGQSTKGYAWKLGLYLRVIYQEPLKILKQEIWSTSPFGKQRGERLEARNILGYCCNNQGEMAMEVGQGISKYWEGKSNQTWPLFRCGGFGRGMKSL